MKKILKKYFISHKGNKHHAHLLHAKRAVFYSLVFLLTKIIMVLFVVLLPVGVFVLPDVLAEEQRQIMELTNRTRQEKNIFTLASAAKLDVSAQHKADDMAVNQYFAHSNNNKSLANWLQEAGYQYQVAGENLAVGFSSAEDIVRAWKNSPSHYANLIDPDFKEIGIGLAGGVYKNQPTVFIVQHFGTPVALAKVEAEPKKVVAKKSSTATVKTEAPASLDSKSVDTAVLAGKIKNDSETVVPVIDTKAPTPIAKYMQAKKVLWPLTNIFTISQNIYLAAMLFFAFVLGLNIATHLKQKKYHVIGQTLGLISLLFIFWKF